MCSSPVRCLVIGVNEAFKGQRRPALHHSSASYPGGAIFRSVCGRRPWGDVAFEVEFHDLGLGEGPPAVQHLDLQRMCTAVDALQRIGWVREVRDLLSVQQEGEMVSLRGS